MAGTSPAMTERSSRALQHLGALAVIAAALLQPFQPAIGVADFIGLVLIEAGFSPRPSRLLLGIFGIDSAREDRIHCDLRKSFHFIPLRLLAAFASLYLALHSVIVSACADLACIPRTATTAAAANKA